MAVPERARRAHQIARETTLWRWQRLVSDQRRVEEAEWAEREAAAEMTRAEGVVDRTAQARDSVAAAIPSPRARVQNVHSRSERPGDDDFLDGSATFVASSARVKFSAKVRAVVVAMAPGLLTSVRRTSLHPPEPLSVRQAWSKMDHCSCQGQLRAAPTLDLVTALRLDHNVAQAPVLWPTPQELSLIHI